MSEISGYLTAGERVIWQGQPQQGIRFVGRDAFLVPFSLIWAGGAIGIPGSIILGSSPEDWANPFVLIGFVFLAAGFYVTVGRLLHDAWLRSRMNYALTDRRALIVRGDEVTSVELSRIDQVQLKGGKDGGRGTVRFGPAASMFNFRGGMGWYLWVPSLEPTPQFMGIERARWVFDQIQAARAKA